MSMKSKRLRRLSALALSVALIATACGGSAVDDTSQAVAEAVPEAAEVAEESGGPGLPALVANTVAGGQFDTNDLAGQDVVVWFWAPW